MCASIHRFQQIGTARALLLVFVLSTSAVCAPAQQPAGNYPSQRSAPTTIRPLGSYLTVQAAIHQSIAQEAGLTPAERDAASRSQLTLSSVAATPRIRKPWQIDLPLPAAPPAQPLAQVTWQPTPQGSVPVYSWQPNAGLSPEQKQAIAGVTGRVAAYLHDQLLRQRGPITRAMQQKMAKTAVRFAARTLALKVSRKMAYKLAGEVAIIAFDYVVK